MIGNLIRGVGDAIDKTRSPVDWLSFGHAEVDSGCQVVCGHQASGEEGCEDTPQHDDRKNRRCRWACVDLSPPRSAVSAPFYFIGETPASHIFSAIANVFDVACRSYPPTDKENCGEECGAPGIL